jgi:hypothetical protein
LTSYDYGFRIYNPAIARFLRVDPLAEGTPSWSPYNYVHGDPISLIDPDGRSAQSPIFDHDGNFLGTDSEGYTGQIVIMRKETYNALTNNGENVLDHNTTEKLVGLGNSIFASDVNGAGLTSEGFSKVFTHVMKQMEGESVDGASLSFDNLEGGIVNVIDLGTDEEGEIANVNLYGNPNNPAMNAVAAQSYSENGEINVTMRLQWGRTVRTHVEDAQSTLGVHEYYGHGVKNHRKSDEQHRKVYKLQVNHKRTYNKLEAGHKKTITRRAKSFKTRN